MFDVCFPVMMCPAPSTISNAVYISNGYLNGSQTLYSCMAGYAGNIGNRIITCNGTHWSNTNLTCSGKQQTFFVLLKGEGSEPISYFNKANIHS